MAFHRQINNTTRMNNMDKKNGLDDSQMSGARFTCAIKALTEWGCGTDEIQAILCVSNSRLNESLNGVKQAFILSKYQLTRISYILSISDSLSEVFKSKEDAYNLLKTMSNAPFFNGRKPIDIIKTGDIISIHQVSCRIKNILQKSHLHQKTMPPGIQWTRGSTFLLN